MLKYYGSVDVLTCIYLHLIITEKERNCAVSIAEKLERLVRIIPGVAGYQDKERSRETDKAVRLRLSSELEQMRLEIEKDKRRFIERHDLSLLPALDTIASRLEKTGNLIRYAARGYSGVFDTRKFDEDTLDRLYAFDLALFDDIESVKTSLRDLHKLPDDRSALKNALGKLEETIEEIEKKFLTRQNIVTTK
jgi:hypothetical protein